MIRRCTGGAAALAAFLGALALCTAASWPQEAQSQSGGAQAPAPGAAPAPLPGSEGGGTEAPEPGAAPAPPPLEPMPVQARAAPPATAQQPQPQPPSTVPKPRPPEQQTPIVVEKRAPPTRQPGTPTIPTLRPTGALGPAAGRLPRTGVDPRLLGAGGTFLIGLGLAMLAVTPPRRV